MKTLLLFITACYVCWAFPIRKLPPRKRRDLLGALDTIGKQTVFDQIFEANKGLIISDRVIVQNLDIAVPLHQPRIGNMCHKGVCLWSKSPDGYVYIPYVISSNYSLFDTFPILTAMKNIEDVSCIRFPQRTTENDYISFEAQTGCWSSIGYSRGGQTISLDRQGCMTTGIANHEILHALGLHHEHVRIDRDQYVEVEWDNIISGYQSNFETTDTLNEDLTHYDYYSVMHYPKNGFAVDSSKPTLTAIPDNSVVFGLQLAMSTLDIVKINTLYKCGLLGYGYDQSLTEQTTSTTTTTPTTITSTTTTTMPTTTTLTSTSTTTTPTTMTSTTTTTTTMPTTTTLTSTTTTTMPTTTTTTAPKTTKTTTATSTTKSTTTSKPSTTTKTTTRTTLYTVRTTITPKTPGTTISTTTATTPTTTQSTTGATIAKVSSQGCGGLITAPSAVITSPNYPDNYPSYAYCHWNITTNSKFQITFTALDIEGTTGGCWFDKLTIYNGRDLISMYRSPDICGQTLPSPIRSYGNTMQIIFTSDAVIERKGFSLFYEPV